MTSRTYSKLKIYWPDPDPAFCSSTNVATRGAGGAHIPFLLQNSTLDMWSTAQPTVRRVEGLNPAETLSGNFQQSRYFGVLNYPILA